MHILTLTLYLSKYLMYFTRFCVADLLLILRSQSVTKADIFKN